MLTILGHDRVHWLAAAALLAACNGVAFDVLSTIAQLGVGSALLNTFGINPIFWFVLLVAAGIAFEADDVANFRRGDFPVFGIVLVLAFVPVCSAGSAGLLLTACWLMITSPESSRGRRVAFVLLALTTSLIWGHLVLFFFGDRLVALDAHFVAWLVGSHSQGNLVDFTNGGDSKVLIGYPCSSIHNMTMAMQLWVGMTQKLRISINLRALLIGLVAIVGNILVNGARLATLASNRATFDYWHQGTGGAIFAWLAVFIVATIVMLGCYALAPRRV